MNKIKNKIGFFKNFYLHSNNSHMKKNDLILIFFVLLIIVLLFCLPVRFWILGAAAEKPRLVQNPNTIRTKAEVLNIDNTNVNQSGIVRTGEQYFEARIIGGDYDGKLVKTVNMLSGTMQLDVFFQKGDQALITVTKDQAGNLIRAQAVDHYRIDKEIILIAVFAFLLILFAGWIGVKAAISFLFTGILIWEILLPGFLAGWHPVFLAFIVVSILTFVIIFLIGGVNLRGLVAYIGSMTGVGLTAGFAIYFGNLMNIHGSVKEFSETLLYSGYDYLDLTAIFVAGIFIASSGAVMDIAMDIAASMAEIKINNPKISISKHIRSGFVVGRAVIGTMTTTLLLAYSGGYTTLLMILMAQGTPVVNILNLRYVAAEFVHTIVGTFGLVLVAPITAVIGGLIYARWQPHLEEQL